MNIYNHNMWRKLNLYVQHCNTIPFTESVIYMGISLYNIDPDQKKMKGKF
jgi:hypothetical protein